VQDDVARYLEEKVAEEEDARPETVDGFAEPEVIHHLEPREPDVHAIQIRDEITEDEDRQEPRGDLTVGGRLEGGIGRA